MIKLDTLKLKFNENVINKVNYELFDKVVRSNNDGVILSQKMVLNSDIKENNGKHYIGLKNIELNMVGNMIGIIELSAKILKENYYNLINKNTIEQVIDTLNSYNIIEFDKNKFLDTVEVYKADITNNLKVSKSPGEYIEILKTYNLNQKYKVEKYNNEAIVFKKDVLSYKQRLILYDKYQEMLRDKREAEILRIENFRNVLRCENNITSFDRLRKNFNIIGKVIFLKDILNSNEQVNYKTFIEITEADNQLLLELNLDEFKNLPLYKIEKRFGQEHIIKAFNFDIKKINQFIKSKIRGRNSYKYLKRYKEVMQSIKERNLFKKEVEVITEIKELLKIA